MVTPIFEQGNELQTVVVAPVEGHTTLYANHSYTHDEGYDMKAIGANKIR